ncbi:MAG: hypothetical protein GX330_08410, partial [Bacteroidales bacterium]|nr:hypothetical protein [Bacteroidales bacterium]
MHFKTIFNTYNQAETVRQIREKIKTNSTFKLHLNGLVGSSLSLVAKACVEMDVGLHFFIFPNKEAAAYFYHDMEQLFGEKQLDFSDRRCLFFPSSFRKVYPTEEIDSYHVLLRTRALKKIQSPDNQLVITYTEA